ncbi:MAG: preprotein translocase subunit YajC [Sphingobacteriales bacterium]|jgi:preprotein translocase subunit YajC
MLHLLMAGQGGGGENPIASFLPIILIGVVFYFFMIRPQMKKAKVSRNFLSDLKKGDKIITVGGIHAKIAELKEEYIIVDAGNNITLKLAKNGISVESSVNLNKKD